MSRDIFSPIDIIKLLPKRPLSKLVGTLTELEVPSPILDTAIEIYKKAYNVERRDFAEGEKYSCFQDYFIRDLLPGRREFAGDKNDFVSPVDGTYSEKIQIRKGSMIKAKDYQFSVAQLLSCYPTAAEYENGTLACLYHAPGNYHKRLYSAQDLELPKVQKMDPL